ncbi:adenylate/guanylate cyclase domain-containing protein [Pseudodesulfovibrio piezophilus]|uniref:Putative Adenylate cyclase 1 n=1 Tax=Pseudodesulfovibrio piezophilus (strain DSM 21447 / JCM 15486 / C1TLV30) TaxID=1322246 RepID=M1WS35_PSEP2|nr:adenylate/guanylate cyclase domain-containing protein [Pseudodesulfovibrio piezophilus]CCH49939.1 putative Adenylate cyclase 1 [Pseudodesulfovibrio piezophilus C1TLV30]
MKIRVPLYVNILTVFALLISAVVAIVVSYGYLRNADTAILSAELLLQRSGSSIVERTQKMFDTAFTTVDTYVSFRDIGVKASIHSHPMSPVFFKFLSQHPDFTSVYIGFDDGDFFLVSSLAERDELKAQLHLPQTALWYTQTIGHMADGRRYEIRKFLDAGFVPVGSDCIPDIAYDPRGRPWFKAALENDIPTLSDIYVFFLSGEPGITVSHRFDSVVSGVVGVDLSLSNLSCFVKRQKVSPSSDIMIFDTEGRIYAYPDTDRLVSSIQLEPHPGMGSEVDCLESPVLTALLEDFQSVGSKTLYSHELIVDGTAYLAHIDPLPTEYGKELFVGVVVPKHFFTGPIAVIGEQTLFVSLIILLLFIPVVYYAAKRISYPLKGLIESAENIKAFRLDIPVNVDSHIIEIRNLSRAMETMRGALKAFGSYIPTPLVEAMVVNDIQPVLGGSRKIMTFFFSDIQDFTAISETLSPELVTESITRYLKVMSQVILENGGTVDKYIGDSIMAFWNAPVEDADHAWHACLSALQCRDVLTAFNADCRERGAPEFLTRMGVHTGDAVVGNIGSSDRMEYTAMGAAVNLASRLEGLNKYLGTGILVSEPTRIIAGDDFCFRFAGKASPKGTSVGLGVFELLGTRSGSQGVYEPFAVSPEVEARLEEWENGVRVFFMREFEKASILFSKYLAEHGADPLVEHYLNLAREYSDWPPSEDWNGEQKFSNK